MTLAPPPLSSDTPPRTHQRVDGRARIAYQLHADGQTRLADLYQRAPCRVLFPDVEAEEPPQAVMLTTSGGLTGGDRIALDAVVGAGARACFSTQAAEKLYRCLPGEADTRMDYRLELGSCAWAEWLAQETILFEGARLRRSLDADLAPDAQLLAVESLVFGRTSMGERFDTGLLHDRWRIRKGGRLIWADALHLEGDVAAQRTLPFGFGDARACATVLLVAPQAAALLDELRPRLEAAHAVQAAGTALDGLLVLRLLATEAAALRRYLMPLVADLRARCTGLPARLPRVWSC